MKSLNSTFIEMGRKQAELFHQNNQVYIDCLVKFDSPRHIMLLAYSVLVGSGKLVPVESLPLEDKNQLWILTKEFAAGRMEKTKSLELAKALYTLEHYMQ